MSQDLYEKKQTGIFKYVELNCLFVCYNHNSPMIYYQYKD